MTAVNMLKLAKQNGDILKFLLEHQLYPSVMYFNGIEGFLKHLMQLHGGSFNLF